jgi:benzoate-CoA ligase family protein
MRIAVVGGGPAGLYFSYLWKRRHPESVVTLFEQNPADATFGFGVVFSDRAMDFIREDDPETAAAISARMETWSDITLVHRCEAVAIDGVGFSAIGRLDLLLLLQERARSAGADLRFGTPIHGLETLAGYDLIVGADGVNSLVRRAHEGDFGTSLSYLDTKFAWFGTTKRFETLTQTFVESEYGLFNAHHYRYAPAMSTFIVECDRATWLAAGLDRLPPDEGRALCEKVFAGALDGHALISNKSVWRNFPWLWNERWSMHNMVLVGDALHTAHYSIGSGTRLAMEDVIALAKALDHHSVAGRPGALAGALQAYEAERRPVVEKLCRASKTSAAWYSDFGAHMRLPPLEFARSYIGRSGRIDDTRLTAMAPRFMARYAAAQREEERRRPAAVMAVNADDSPAECGKARGGGTPSLRTDLADRVPRDAPGAREIGFEVPQRYNASAILFDNLARGRGARVAVTGPAGTRTYAEMCEDAARFGNALLGLGLTRGERVLLFLDDTPAYPAALMGALRAGLVPLLINTQSPPDLVRFYIEDAGARVAVVEAAFAERFATGALAGTPLTTIIVSGGPAPGGLDAAALDAAPLLAAQATRLDAADTYRDDMAFWMYSSGSTGRPKGIVHLQHDMAYTVASYADHVLALTPDDICFSVPKIFFAYGFGNSISFPFAAGAASVLLPGQPKPAAIFNCIARYRPTLFFGLPTLYTALAKSPEARGADLSSLRLCLSAAEILSVDVFNAWKTLSGQEIVEGLGSTEVLHIYLSNRPDAKRSGAAGLRVPGYEIALKTSDGQPVGDGEEGILWVRGDSSAPCYWNRPDKTAETMREDGWIHTGDRFVRDADGFHFFRGRADDLVKVSGQWVYPLEIELCLAEHPLVRECAVFAFELPDRRTSIRRSSP